MKGQTRRWSLIEISSNLFIGMFVAYWAQIIVFPIFDIEVTHATNFKIMLIFTAISFVRGYLMRRLFNMIMLYFIRKR